MSADKTDPGASVNGTYMSALEGIAAAANYPDIRLMSKCMQLSCRLSEV